MVIDIYKIPYGVATPRLTNYEPLYFFQKNTSDTACAAVSRIQDLLLMVVAIVATFGAAWVNTWFSPGNWYASLVRPPLVPPNWVFGPVWSLLYTLMAIAAVMVLHAGFSRPDVRIATALYAVQILLNGTWSWLYFGEHLIGWAVVNITLLLCSIFLTARAFGKIRPWAGRLMCPYLAWIGFATYLNAGFFWLNE